MKKTIFSTLIAVVVFAGLLSFPACKTETKSKAPYRALIVTGQNNHTWQGSTPVLQQILENTGLFAVDIAQSSATGGDMSTFSPVFTNYEVVVLDYTGDPWPDETRSAFESYVSGGGGVVVYHAADNAFREWKEYNRITGLGGWSDRNETDGPYVRWRNGEIVRDTFAGRGGSHGQQHAFRVTNQVTDHPITSGLPEVWLHAQDELYSELRGPAENLTVLATAYADTAKGGTGEHEPILMTIQYGKGRVFHTVIGHAMGDGPYPAMECVGFIVTLQRGAEWAATGEVTQAVPDEFPHFNVESNWPHFRPLELEELLAEFKDYYEGDSRVNAEDIKQIFRRKSVAGDFGTIEPLLIQFLRSKATVDSKSFICRELSLFGTDKALPTLEKLMKDEDMDEIARFAYERITGNYTN